MTLTSTEFAVAQEIYFKITTGTWANETSAGNILTVALPRFTSGDGYGTDGTNIRDMQMAPSRYFNTTWLEGTFDHDSPYNRSYLSMELREALPSQTEIEITIFKSNGIKVFCGFPTDWSELKWSIDAIGVSDTLFSTPMMGSQCEPLNYCSQRGTCDYCLEVCECWDGAGNEDDVTDLDLPKDCSGYICSGGKAIRGLPTDNTNLIHDSSAECGDNGICNREEMLCECAKGWEGNACVRQQCPGDCSEHGVCLSMADLGRNDAALPLCAHDHEYGTPATHHAASWDHDVGYACVCDSSWPVGLGANETQQAEWFGPDCSLRRCPTGDDPFTDADETDCEGAAADGGRGVGQAGNLCHVDCSNRGLCDYETGKCTCFKGYYGENCGKMHVLAGFDGNS